MIVYNESGQKVSESLFFEKMYNNTLQVGKNYAEDVFYYEGDVIIPSFQKIYEIDTGSFTDLLPVTSIKDSCFLASKEMSSVIIPNSIKYIGESAFSGCEKLQKIHLPYSIKKIEQFAFSGCINLKEISMDFSFLKEIKEGVFADCYELEEVFFKSNIKRIFSYAFNRCEKLKCITVAKDSVIERFAFGDRDNEVVIKYY